MAKIAYNANNINIPLISWDSITRYVGDPVSIEIHIANSGTIPVEINGNMELTRPNGQWFRTFSFFGSLSTSGPTSVGVFKTTIEQGGLTDIGNYAVNVKIWNKANNELLDDKSSSNFITVIQREKASAIITLVKAYV